MPIRLFSCLVNHMYVTPVVPVYLRSVSFVYNNNNEKNAVMAARREKAPRSPSGRWRRFGSFLHGALQPFPVYVRGASFFFNNNKEKKRHGRRRVQVFGSTASRRLLLYILTS